MIVSVNVVLAWIGMLLTVGLSSVFNAGEHLWSDLLWTKPTRGYEIALHTDGLSLRHALQQRRSPGSLLLVTAPGENPGNEFGVKKP